MSGWAYVPEGQTATCGPVNLNPELIAIYHGVTKPTSFNAELTALLEALRYINSQPPNETTCTIIGDCIGSLGAARGYSSPKQDIQLLKLLRNEWSKAGLRQTTATWTAAHQGPAGNELADLAAKRACSREYSVENTAYAKFTNEELQFSMSTNRIQQKMKL